MPYSEPDGTDPLERIGVTVPVDDIEESTREMAEVFIEEYLRLGHSPGRILSLFRRPFYAGPHQALVRLGEAEIERLIDSKARIFGRKPDRNLERNR